MVFIHCSEKPIIAQLGFRFWDSVRNVQVSDGLEVTARTVNSGSRIYQAFQTLSGNYAFRGLPGFHDVEYPSNGPAAPNKRKRTKLIIEVKDLQQMFLPFAFLFDEEIPLAYQGIYRSGIFDEIYPASPPESALPVFYLYSAPTRPIMPGMAVVRCSLQEYADDKNKNASHAFIEVAIKGKKWFGMANKDGNAVVYFPYPTVDNVFYGTSPPLSISRSLKNQKWQVSVGIHYSPDTLTFLRAANLAEAVAAGADEKILPELGSILRQHRAYIWSHDPESTPGSTADFELNEELIYGRELILRTDNKSELFLEIAPTSP